MKDNNFERPEDDSSQEEPVFPDGDLEDYLEIGGESTEGEEMSRAADPPPQVLASLKRQRRSKRSVMLIVLLCLGLGALVLVVFLVMKPEVKKPRIVAKQMKPGIPSGERGDVSTTPAAAEKEKREEEAFKGRRPEGERPVSSEPTIVIQEKGTRKKVFILGEEEVTKVEEEARVAEGEGIGSEIEKKSQIEDKEEGKRTVAKVEGAKPRAITKVKPAAGRYTVNVGSFRERARAERLMRKLEGKGYRAFVAEAAIPKKGTWYRVSVGRFSSREDARGFAGTLKEKEGMNSFVREFKE